MQNLLISDYTLLEKIGEGGFGIVYKARQTSTGQLVAIKVLKNTHSQKTQITTCFEQETQLCAQINHPHVIKLLDKGYAQDGQPFAVFDYVDGEPLKEQIIWNNGLSAIETGRLMGQVLNALVCIHGQGIIHRDLKPQNIMVAQTQTGSQAKILDFGSAVFTRKHPINECGKLKDKATVGTPGYSAPEQLRGEIPTVRSDMYTWGLILLECLTGAPVIQGNTPSEVFAQQVSPKKVPIPASIHHHPLSNLLRWVLEKNPLKRAGNALKLYKAYLKIDFKTLTKKVNTKQIREFPNKDLTIDNDWGK